MKLTVSEIFYSIQGEGNTIGVPSLFIRMSDCNLACSFCDTKFAWGEGKEIFFDEILYRMIKYDVRNIVFTGGEPLIFQKEIKDFLYYAQNKNILKGNIEIETNGTISPTELVNHFHIQYNVSPKLSNSHTPLTSRYKSITLDFLNRLGNSIFKFVYDKNSEFEILEMVNKHIFKKERVFIMPKGDTVVKLDKTTDDAIKFAMKHSFNYSPRLQVMLWGNRRGV